MIPARALLFLLLIVPAEAQTLPGTVPSFPTALSDAVFTQALAFMQPRTLAPYSLPTLALWGLPGLTALDPSFTTDLSAGTLRLSLPDRILAVQPEPPANDVAGWGAAIAALAAAAWQESLSVRAVGPNGVTEAFFDELFNHFDPYSRYVAPAEAASERARRSGWMGTGLTVALESGVIVVVSVVAGSPAGDAHILPGDRILSVDGATTRGRTARWAEDEMAGPEGSPVVLTFADPVAGVRTVRLARHEPAPETVFASRVHEMLVLRISAFDASTGQHLANEIAAGLSVPNPPQGIVLDLRGNRGGLLDQAVFAADVLLHRGIIATTAGRDPAARHVWAASGADMAGDLPVVVVVDGLTASAAEILTASLADNGRAVVVGSATLGKGLVQTIDQLPDGGELFVTWSQVLAPRGWPIQSLGILPQVCTSLGQPALDRQLALLAGGSQPMARAIYQHETARVPLPLAQILAIRAACPAAVGSEADMAAARVLIDNPAAYAAALLPPAGRALFPPE
ncbi:MAG TPA: S41 family peptidase [Acetobacteraceae bacterium]|nr:S41 family peptidase [Acetobacteraceae bacterium]